MGDRSRALAEIARRYGVREAGLWVFSRSANRVCALEVHRVRLLELARMTRETARDARFESRFLTPLEVRAFSSDPANDISAGFAARAEQGHLCFAALLDGGLASYAWYAIGSVEPQDSVGVRLAFPADTAYAYKAYTRPEHRGKHLHGRLKQPVIEDLLARGIRRRLALIEWTNHASLRTSTRSGYRDLGLLLTAGRKRHRILARPAAALREGIRFGDA